MCAFEWKIYQTVDLLSQRFTTVYTLEVLIHIISHEICVS